MKLIAQGRKSLKTFIFGSALLLAMDPTAVQAAIEIRVQVVLAPFGRLAEAEPWGEFRVRSPFGELSRRYPAPGPGPILTRYSVAEGLSSIAGDLDLLLFPSVIFVGRSCPPQEHAELFEIRPARGRVERSAVPVEELTPRDFWREYKVKGVDRVVAVYHCFPADHTMKEVEFPPERGTEPPPPSRETGPVASDQEAGSAGSSE